MSGLYNLVSGVSSGDRHSVAMYLLPGVDFGRFRDMWLERIEGDIQIAVYTRNGGGNRDDYETQIEAMRSHPLFVEDADDDYDSTYATFYFRYPPDHEVPAADLANLAYEGRRDMSAWWKNGIASILDHK